MVKKTPANIAKATCGPALKISSRIAMANTVTMAATSAEHIRKKPDGFPFGVLRRGVFSVFAHGHDIIMNGPKENAAKATTSKPKHFLGLAQCDG